MKYYIAFVVFNICGAFAEKGGFVSIYCAIVMAYCAIQILNLEGKPDGKEKE